MPPCTLNTRRNSAFGLGNGATVTDGAWMCIHSGTGQADGDGGKNENFGDHLPSQGQACTGGVCHPAGRVLVFLSVGRGRTWSVSLAGFASWLQHVRPGEQGSMT